MIKKKPKPFRTAIPTHAHTRQYVNLKLDFIFGFKLFIAEKKVLLMILLSAQPTVRALSIGKSLRCRCRFPLLYWMAVICVINTNTVNVPCMRVSMCLDAKLSLREIELDFSLSDFVIQNDFVRIWFNVMIEKNSNRAAIVFLLDG